MIKTKVIKIVVERYKDEYLMMTPDGDISCYPTVKAAQKGVAKYIHKVTGSHDMTIAEVEWRAIEELENQVAKEGQRRTRCGQ